MRLGVVDVGSNTVRLVVADGDGAAPLPVHTAKRRLRLAEQVDAGGRLGDAAVEQVVDAVAAAVAEARRWGCGEPFAFATAIVRDAPNRDEVLETVRSATGTELHVMSGQKEAELTFLAVRRWMGWQAGPMVLLDIGGGSLEVAVGRSRMPDFAASLPLGAGRLTREYLDGDGVTDPDAVRELRRRVRHDLRDVATRVRWEAPRTAAATSRTFQQLARLCGAAPGREGPFVERRLVRADLRHAMAELAALPPADRARLPGISPPRAGQSLAGAVVAHTAMKLMGIDAVTVSPWALREGVLLRQLEEPSASPVGDAGSGGERPAAAAPLRLTAARGG
ncbi:Ppx/GppA family phosphatase [Streptomyces sp. TRM 70351]|uniref:Ppx/GppA phosphatase family protein n=1 Tax=Streptomyces sp. TRM 70351 TaxID=3116552 RepID=UPI002E7C27C7|nr:Ppx/GppA family phosphatase [Streptomyces sp. TRM 70351]MEE1927133.1 Ppx/GppA family phosphatase [Streptomyces sp. TRM 70351]